MDKQCIKVSRFKLETHKISDFHINKGCSAAHTKRPEKIDVYNLFYAILFYAILLYPQF